MTTKEIMKPTKFKASTHRCSVCCYRSLLKSNVYHHVKSSKCEGATVITEEKIVSHTDEHDSEVFKATLYQCSKCLHTTCKTTNINTHVSKTCVGADIICSKRILCFDDVPKPATATGNVSATQGDNSIAAGTIQNSFNTTNIILVPPQTKEEYAAWVNALRPLLDRCELKLSTDMSDIPAAIYAIARSTDPRLDNKHITHNDVVNRVDGSTSTKGKHSKQEISRLMTALYDAFKSKPDGNVFLDPEFDKDFEDILDVRRRLLPIFFKDDCLDTIDDAFDETVVERAEGCDAFVKHSDFFLGCRLLVEDPSKFKNLPLDVQKQVRLAAKKYLSSLPIETKTRSNACIDKLPFDVPLKSLSA